MKTVLVTGACGEVATHLRRELAGRYRLRLSDLRPLEGKSKSEIFMQADRFAVSVLAALAFVYANALDLLVKFSTGAYFVGFLCPVAALLYVRLRGRWTPHAEGPYRGRFGYVVTVVAFFWALAEAINIAWPRATGGKWTDDWAVLLGLAVFAALGAVYFAIKRPDRLLQTAGADEEAAVAAQGDAQAMGVAG